jgi:hypothetical protein
MSNCKELKMAMFFYFGKPLVAKGMLTLADPFSPETRVVPGWYGPNPAGPRPY